MPSWTASAAPSSEVLGITPKIKTTATATITADQFFAWAQTNFAAFFPGSPATTTSTGFVFRAYSSGNAIAVTTSVLSGLPAGTILVLGPVTGNALVPLGSLTAFNCTVAPSNCTPSNPNPGTGGGSGNYADCFGTVLLTPGHTYQIDMSNSVNGSVVQTTTNKYTVNQQTTFKGNTAIELLIDTTLLTSSAGGAGTTVRTKAYSFLTGDFYSTYGTVVSTAIPGFGSYDMTVYFDPAIKTPTNLASGQSYTVNTTQKYESSNALFASFLPTPVSYTYSFTYLGKESVTTPAGTFSACKTTSTASPTWARKGVTTPAGTFSACKTTSPTVSGTTTSLVTSWLVAEGRYKGLFLKSDDGKGHRVGGHQAAAGRLLSTVPEPCSGPAPPPPGGGAFSLRCWSCVGRLASLCGRSALENVNSSHF